MKRTELKEMLTHVINGLFGKLNLSIRNNIKAWSAGYLDPFVSQVSVQGLCPMSAKSISGKSKEIFSEFLAIKIFTGLIKLNILRRVVGNSLYLIAYNFYRTSTGNRSSISISRSWTRNQQGVKTRGVAGVALPLKMSDQTAICPGIVSFHFHMPDDDFPFLRKTVKTNQ